MSQTPLKDDLYLRLTRAFSPLFLEIVDESAHHRSHREGGGEETHFQVTLVASFFIDKNHLQRHRAVQEVLKDLLISSIHALSLKMWTPQEYEQIPKE